MKTKISEWLIQNLWRCYFTVSILPGSACVLVSYCYCNKLLQIYACGCTRAKLLLLCPTLCNPMDCNLQTPLSMLKCHLLLFWKWVSMGWSQDFRGFRELNQKISFLLASGDHLYFLIHCSFLPSLQLLPFLVPFSTLSLISSSPLTKTLWL